MVFLVLARSNYLFKEWLFVRFSSKENCYCTRVKKESIGVFLGIQHCKLQEPRNQLHNHGSFFLFNFCLLLSKDTPKYKSRVLARFRQIVFRLSYTKKWLNSNAPRDRLKLLQKLPLPSTPWNNSSEVIVFSQKKHHFSYHNVLTMHVC